MKIKKLLTVLMAGCLCVSSAFTLTACGGNDDVDDIDEVQHNYGDWQIVKMPSDYNEGLVERVCSDDTERDHVISEVMPSFARSAASAAKYETLSTQDHITTFTYKCDDGETVTATTIANIEDAIALGMSNKSEVVGGTVNVFHDYKFYGTQAGGNIYYEFGDNYVHVSDNVINKRDTFYELNEDGTVFAVGLEWKSLALNEDPNNENSAVVVHNYQEALNDKYATSDMMGGFGFNFTWLNGSTRSFGLENFIEFIYNNYFEIDPNNDRSASIETLSDGTLRFDLSVSVTDTMTTFNFHKINVSFTLDENYVIKTAEISNSTWTNPVLDPDSGSYVAPEGDYKVMDMYSVVQSTERGEGVPVPVNPYVYEDMLITSYDMIYDGNTLKNGDTITIDANSNTIISLENFAPDTFNLYFDEITVTLAEADNPDNVKDCISSSIDLTDGEIMTMVSAQASYNGEAVVMSHSLQIKSLYAGDFILTIKSAKLTKTLNLTVNKVAPENFGTNVYEFNALNQVYEIDNYNTEFTVYEGQAFNFTSFVGHPYYEEAGFTLNVTGGDNYTVTDNVLEIAGASVSVKKFVAAKAGDYEITLLNDKDPQITTVLKVHVLEAPEMSELVNGEYFNLNESLYITFTPDAVGATTGTAKVIWDKDKKGQAETDYTYTCDDVNKTVTLTAASGESRNAKIYFDDAYNMYIEYSGSFGRTMKVYLYDEVPNLIEGTYRITKAASDAARLEVNVEGTYEISADSYAGVYYAIYNADTDRQIGDNVRVSSATEVDLEIGQYIKVWTIGVIVDENGNSAEELPVEYTITFIAPFDTDL